MAIKALTTILTAFILVGCASTLDSFLKRQESIYKVGDCIEFTPDGRYKTDTDMFIIIKLEKVRTIWDRLLSEEQSKEYMYTVSQFNKKVGYHTTHTFSMGFIRRHMKSCD